MIKVRNPEDLNEMEKRGQICDVNKYPKDVMADEVQRYLDVGRVEHTIPRRAS